MSHTSHLTALIPPEPTKPSNLARSLKHAPKSPTLLHRIPPPNTFQTHVPSSTIIIRTLVNPPIMTATTTLARGLPNEEGLPMVSSVGSLCRVYKQPRKFGEVQKFSDVTATLDD